MNHAYGYFEDNILRPNLSLFLINICHNFFFNWQTDKIKCFRPMKNLFSFLLLELRKIRGSNWLGKLAKTSEEFFIT